MASLTVLQFKIYNHQKQGEITKQDAQFFINTIESLITHDVITLEQAIDNMYENFTDYFDFKEQLKCVTVSDNNKFLFDYVDSFCPEYEEVLSAVSEIREELFENIETK